MNTGKPKHVKKEIWQQHLDWMKVMDGERARNKAKHKPRKDHNSLGDQTPNKGGSLRPCSPQR